MPKYSFRPVLGPRTLLILIALWAFIVSSASAQSGIPACNKVVDDPTLATCTCTCESGSKYPGCLGLAVGVEAPTPNQCPDMLRGRRTLSRGDSLLLADPVPFETGSYITATRIYPRKEDSVSGSGIGTVGSTPLYWQPLHFAPCTSFEGLPFPQQTRLARLFDLPHNSLLSVEPSTDADAYDEHCSPSAAGATNMSLYIKVDPSDGDTRRVEAHSFTIVPIWLQVAIDDFDFDGFDDIAVLNQDNLRVFSATDPTDPDQGFVAGTQASTKSATGAFSAPLGEPTTGDFNGDGLLEVAWVGGNLSKASGSGSLSVFFATICPGNVPGTVCAGAQRFKVIFDPAAKLFNGATSTIALDDSSLEATDCGAVIDISERGSTHTGSLRAAAVALGNFEANGFSPRGNPVDELVVTYVSGSTKTLCTQIAQFWHYAEPTSSSPVWAKQPGSALSLQRSAPAPSGTNVFSLYATAAYLDWYGPVEQAVIGVGQLDKDLATWYPVVVAVDGVEDGATPYRCPGEDQFSSSRFTFLWGMDVGRLTDVTTVSDDNPDACLDFANSTPGQCPYNPQMALFLAKNLGDTQSDTVGRVKVYTFTPEVDSKGRQCYTAKQSSEVELDTDNGFNRMEPPFLRAGSMLRSGDATGAAVRVGTPLITRIDHITPTLVMEAPPAHVAYVQTPETSAPAIVNFSRVPEHYTSQFEFEISSEATASVQHHYSATNSTAESFDFEFKLNVGTSLSGKMDNTLSQYHESTNSSELGTYSERAQSTKAVVGEDDQILWTSVSHNVFHFPVVGQTTCPESIRCSPDDVGTSGCSEAASGVLLSCEATGDGGCHCLSDGADDASFCLGIPANSDLRHCTESSDDVCCSLRQPPYYVSFSGPVETTRNFTSGANLEWYQPRHEPGQILSYPASTALLAARTTGPVQLAQLDGFDTGSNSVEQTISWTCSTDSSVSTGTATTLSFDSENSLSVGTNELEKAVEGTKATLGLDFQGSTTHSTLNTNTFAQTESSNVSLSIDGADFLVPSDYGYTVAGGVYGRSGPTSALDNPDIKTCPASSGSPICDASKQVQVDCSAVGPLRVGFAADPTGSGNGIWWSSTAPYNDTDTFDLALNNPSRWKRASSSDVSDSDLQCRGDPPNVTCYTNNPPPDLDSVTSTLLSTSTPGAEVWGAPFYNMKGLTVVVGNFPALGPQRSVARLDDQVHLTLLAQNYSLTDMPAGSTAYARFYRQQVDVNESNGTFAVLDYAKDADGDPLPAVPIGIKGAEDKNKVPLFTPEGGSNLFRFNTTSLPVRDNTGIASVAFTVEDGDECEFDDGIQNCDGAYYAFWVTVWAEDENGNVLAELEGTGLGADFKPKEIYKYITDVPLDTVEIDGETTSFTNNVGMFKQIIALLPAATPGPLEAALPTIPTLDFANLSKDRAKLFEPVVVSAHVVADGASPGDVTVLFSEEEAAQADVVFDAEFLPHVRTDDRHFVQAIYYPERCGTHKLRIELASDGHTFGNSEWLWLDVEADVDGVLSRLFEMTNGLVLDFPGKSDKAHRMNLLRELTQARSAFDAGDPWRGARELEGYLERVEWLDLRRRIRASDVRTLTILSNEVIDCYSS